MFQHSPATALILLRSMLLLMLLLLLKLFADTIQWHSPHVIIIEKPTNGGQRDKDENLARLFCTVKCIGGVYLHVDRAGNLLPGFDQVTARIADEPEGKEDNTFDYATRECKYRL